MYYYELYDYSLRKFYWATSELPYQKYIMHSYLVIKEEANGSRLLIKDRGYNTKLTDEQFFGLNYRQQKQMKHVFPKGAITSVKELTFAFLGKPVFHAYGIKKPFIEVLFDCRDLQAIEDGTLRGSLFFMTDAEKFIDIGARRCFLNDVNIGSHFNGNYLFYKLSDALAYLQSLGCDYKPGPDLLKYDNYLDVETTK